MSLPDASKKLGWSTQSIRNACRRHGILNWPFILRRKALPGWDTRPGTKYGDFLAAHAKASAAAEATEAAEAAVLKAAAERKAKAAAQAAAERKAKAAARERFCHAQAATLKAAALRAPSPARSLDLLLVFLKAALDARAAGESSMQRADTPEQPTQEDKAKARNSTWRGRMCAHGRRGYRCKLCHQ